MKALFALFAVIFTLSSPVQAQYLDPCIDAVASALADVESKKTGIWLASKTCDGSGGNYYMYVSWDDGCTGLCTLLPWIEASVDVKAGTCTATYAPNGAGITQTWDGYTSGEARQLKTDLKAICNEIVDVPACP